jgi:hypothetical protein
MGMLDLIRREREARAVPACLAPTTPTTGWSARSAESVVYIGIDVAVDDEETVAGKIAAQRAAGWNGKIETVRWPPPMEASGSASNSAAPTPEDVRARLAALTPDQITAAAARAKELTK